MLISYYTINVLGRLWDPSCREICAYQYRPGTPESIYPRLVIDTEASLEVNRAGLFIWLAEHAGDFQSIEDFMVSTDDGNHLIPWKNPDSQQIFCDCMFP